MLPGNQVSHDASKGLVGRIWRNDRGRLAAPLGEPVVGLDQGVAGFADVSLGRLDLMPERGE
jgi:hypothetical protein